MPHAHAVLDDSHAGARPRTERRERASRALRGRDELGVERDDDGVGVLEERDAQPIGHALAPALPQVQGIGISLQLLCFPMQGLIE